MKIQIMHRLEAKVLFECEADSLKIALELAVKQKVDLDGANLDGANLSGANLSGAKLDGEKLDKCPIQLLGLKWFVLITKKNIKIGCELHTAEEWFKFPDKRIALMNRDALAWWKDNKKVIKALWENHCKS